MDEAKRLKSLVFSGYPGHEQVVEHIGMQLYGKVQEGGEAQAQSECSLTVFMSSLSPVWGTELIEGLIMRGLLPYPNREVCSCLPLNSVVYGW